MKKYNFLFFSVLLGLAIVSFLYIKNLNEFEEYKKTTDTELDEMTTQNFILQTEIGRYEIAIERYGEKNPSGAKELEYILSHETE